MSDTGRPRFSVVKGERKDVPIRSEPGALRRRCVHDHVVVDSEARTITCDDCKAIVDPYEAIERIAYWVHEYRFWRDRYRDEARVAERTVKELKRVEVNVKARVRTAARKISACKCESQASYGRFCRDCGGRIER
jgi:hypothetical protein